MKGSNGKTSETGARVDAVSVACVDVAQPDSCRLLQLSLRTDRQGGFRGQLNVFIAGAQEPLRLDHSGLVTAPDTRIQDLGEIDADTRIHRTVPSREREP